MRLSGVLVDTGVRGGFLARRNVAVAAAVGQGADRGEAFRPALHHLAKFFLPG